MTRRATQAKFVPVVEPVSDLRLRVVCVSSGSVWTIAAERARCGFLVVDLGGNGVDGVDLHGHGQLVHVAVVQDAAAGSDLKGALLLLLGALHIFVVANDLQPEQPRGDGEGPEEERRGR